MPKMPPAPSPFLSFFVCASFFSPRTHTSFIWNFRYIHKSSFNNVLQEGQNNDLKISEEPYFVSRESLETRSTRVPAIKNRKERGPFNNSFRRQRVAYDCHAIGCILVHSVTHIEIVALLSRLQRNT